MNLKSPGRLNIILALVLVISLINLAFNIQSLTNQTQEALRPPQSSGGGVIPQVPGSGSETQTAGTTATDSGAVMGTADNATPAAEADPELEFASFLDVENSQTCQWDNLNGFIASASLTPEKQLITLATSDLSQTTKFLKTQLVGYLWNPEQPDGYRFLTKDLNEAYEYLKSFQSNPEYLTLLDLALGVETANCENNEVTVNTLSLPQFVNFEQIPPE